MATERIQKILARAGIASRRKAEELIIEGLVTVNGKVAKLGDKAEFGRDAIKVSGKLIHATEPPVYLAMYKPKNVISMLADPQGRPTIAGLLSRMKYRVFPVGRLDFTSEGLLLLTNNGAFAEELQKRGDIPRVYHAKVKGHPEPDAVERLKRGLRVGHRLVRPHAVRVVEELASKARIELVFLESGAIDVKTFLERKGFLVERISRTAIGHLTIHGLTPGQFRLLKASQAEALLKQPELGLRRLEFEGKKAEEKRERKIEGRERAEARERRGPKPSLPRPKGSKPKGSRPGLPRPKSAPSRGIPAGLKITSRRK